MPIIIIGLFVSLLGLGMGHRKGEMKLTESERARIELQMKLQDARENHIMSGHTFLSPKHGSNGAKIPQSLTRYSSTFIDFRP